MLAGGSLDRTLHLPDAVVLRGVTELVVVACQPPKTNFYAEFASCPSGRGFPEQRTAGGTSLG